MNDKWVIEFLCDKKGWMLSARNGNYNLENAVEAVVDAQSYNTFPYRIRNIKTNDIILAAILTKQGKTRKGHKQNG